MQDSEGSKEKGEYPDLTFSQLENASELSVKQIGIGNIYNAITTKTYEQQ